MTPLGPVPPGLPPAGQAAPAYQAAPPAGAAPPGQAALLARTQSFVAWLAAYGETSQDQYDFWANRVGKRAKRLAYEHHLAGMAAAAPFVALDTLAPRSRRLFRGKQRFPIADAHYAMGFFNLAETAMASALGTVSAGSAGSAGSNGSTASALASGRHYLEALSASRALGFENAAWGYPFDWVGWFGTFTAGTPFITTTAYCYDAFEQGYLLTEDAPYLETMLSIARFAHEDLVDQETAPGAFAGSYGPFDRRRVVNASAYRALLLTKAGLRFERDDWLKAAQGNTAFVLQSQQSDGSWLYAMDERDRFVDNFHTCLVLKNLVKLWAATSDEAVQDAVLKGYDFYKRSLLDVHGLPVPFARASRLNLVRRELYDLAEGLNLALLMRGVDPDADAIAGRFLEELLDHWSLRDGHFVTRITYFGKNKVPYHRWAQAQTFHALTCALREAPPLTAAAAVDPHKEV